MNRNKRLILKYFEYKKIFLNKLSFSSRHQEVFFKSLGFLISAGIPIAESLTILFLQQKNKRIKNILQNIQQAVAQGESISTACSHFPYIFNMVIVARIKGGELSGSLALALADLAHEQKNNRETRNKLVGMLIYPCIILFAGIILLAVLIIFVFPRLISVFTSTSVPLPLITRFVISLGNFVTSYGLLVLLFIGLIFGQCIFLWKKSTRFRKFIENGLIKVPILGPINKRFFGITCFSTLADLLSSHIPIVEALLIVCDSSNFLIQQEYIRGVRHAVIAGESLHQAFLTNKEKFIPDSMLDMIAVGERSGMLDKTLKSTADFHRADLTESLSRLAVFVEPMVMIGIGFCIGLVALSIVSPMYALTQHVGVAK